MKVRITYNPAEVKERTAANLIGTDCKKVLQLLGGTHRIKESDGNAPHRVVYISGKLPAQGPERGEK